MEHGRRASSPASLESSRYLTNAFTAAAEVHTLRTPADGIALARPTRVRHAFSPRERLKLVQDNETKGKKMKRLAIIKSDMLRSFLF